MGKIAAATASCLNQTKQIGDGNGDGIDAKKKANHGGRIISLSAIGAQARKFLMNLFNRSAAPAKPRLTKADISGPENFVHRQHIGFDAMVSDKPVQAQPAPEKLPAAVPEIPTMSWAEEMGSLVFQIPAYATIGPGSDFAAAPAGSNDVAVAGTGKRATPRKPPRKSLESLYAQLVRSESPELTHKTVKEILSETKKAAPPANDAMEAIAIAPKVSVRDRIRGFEVLNAGTPSAGARPKPTPQPAPRESLQARAQGPKPLPRTRKSELPPATGQRTTERQPPAEEFDPAEHHTPGSGAHLMSKDPAVLATAARFGGAK